MYKYFLLIKRKPTLVLFLLFILLLLWLITGCEEKKDKYYKRPESLEPPIYQILEEKGNFSSFLKCIEKAGYKDILNRAGYFTVFAPTDEAFSQFLTENSYTSVNEIDTLTIRKIVSYALVSNAYTRDKLDDYQSTDMQAWEPDIAFKRKTTFSKWVYNEDVNGKMEKVVDQNGVPQLPGTGSVFIADDNNYRHIPYFTTNYFSTANLTSYDYNYFFPQTDFSGLNVVDAKVTESDLLAENGVIYVVDKVILPLPNLEELLASNTEYSKFKSIVDNYMRYYYLAPSYFISRYEQFSGISEDVYIKHYPYLNYGLNCENFLRYGGGEDYDAQIDGWTLFAPTNDAVQQFFDSKFLVHYGSLDNMSPELISDFINAHMFRTTVWPSKFDVTANPFGEEARFDAENDVIEKKFGSNGIFYGVNKVQATDAFYTILGEINLNPDYSLMLQALNTAELNFVVKNPNLKFTVFIIPNDAFIDLGLSYDVDRNSWNLDNPDLGTNASVAISRIIHMHIILNKELTNLSGNDIIETYGGEYIRYAGGFIWAAGNRTSTGSQEVIIPKNKKEASNGISYTLETALKYSIKNIGNEIKREFGASQYYKYLLKSAETLNGYVYDTLTQAIANVVNTENNTLLVPTDAAIQDAVTSGLLPALPSYGPFVTQDDLDKVLYFVMYHVMAKSIVVPNGEINGIRETLYKTVDGKTYVTVVNDAGSLTIIDNNDRTANLVPGKYNILSNRAVIHQIDNYLSY